MLIQFMFLSVLMKVYALPIIVSESDLTVRHTYSLPADMGGIMFKRLSSGPITALPIRPSMPQRLGAQTIQPIQPSQTIQPIQPSQMLQPNQLLQLNQDIQPGEAIIGLSNTSPPAQEALSYYVASSELRAGSRRTTTTTTTTTSNSGEILGISSSLTTSSINGGPNVVNSTGGKGQPPKGIPSKLIKSDGFAIQLI